MVPADYLQGIKAADAPNVQVCDTTGADTQW